MSDEPQSKSRDRETHADISVRPADRKDLPVLNHHIQSFIDANRLLPRTTVEMEFLVQVGFVAEAGQEFVGFSALEIYSPKLAEIRSLFVLPNWQGRGVGRRLVNACLDLAREKNILEVMAITSTDGFFLSCGFDYSLPQERKALFFQTRDQY